MNWETLDADINKILTKHFTAGRSGAKINKIIIHYNAGNLTVEGCYSVWQTREASAHYQVEASGRIGQLVWDSDTAWHAGNWAANISSIGIEHANGANGVITDACLDAGAHLVAALCKKFGLGRPQWGVNLFGHSDFAATACPGPSLKVGGAQHNEYVSRAQKWYDQMVNGAEAPSTGGSTTTTPSTGGKKSVAEVAKDVIAGAYGNGDARKAALEAAGYNYAEVQAEVNRQLGVGGTATTTPQKTVDQLAQEVINGAWGKGTERQQRLTAAGYDYNAVQAKVNQILTGTSSGGKTIDQIAREVIAGQWGKGADRKARLQAAGYNYDAVQARVNQLLS